MKALVTGGTGFIGSHVVDLLAAGGHDVHIFSRSSKPEGDTVRRDSTVVRGDLRNPPSLVRAMEGMDVVYHVGEIKNVSRRTAGLNTALLKAVVPVLAGGGAGRFVFVSSITVAGIPGSLPADENTEPRTKLVDHYTAYKRAGENLLAGHRPEIDHVVIRPAPVYGPGSRYLGRLIAAIKRVGPWGLPFIGRGDSLAPLIQVEDLARAVVAAGFADSVGGEVLNITDGIRHSWRDFIDAIGQALGRRIRLVAVAPNLVRFPALSFDRIAGFFGFDFSLKDYIDYFTEDLLFSNDKAKTLLGWTPKYTDLSDGAAEMVRFYEGERR